MWSIVKSLFFILLALVMLAVILPLLWIVIKETGLFGGSMMSMGSDAGYIIITILCVIFIIWGLATWNS
jgi:hypothetical protein